MPLVFSPAICLFFFFFKLTVVEKATHKENVIVFKNAIGPVHIEKNNQIIDILGIYMVI